MSSSQGPLARAGRRVMVAGAGGLVALLALSGPAFAHAEVEADAPQALATDVTLTFVSEAESATAGFTQVRIVLPEGITLADVTLDNAPKGWKLKAADGGYSVGGPALKRGVDAGHKIKIKQLPDANQLVFKTVETYSDGKISRWIEIPSGSEEPEQPAPVLKLKPSASDASPPASSPTVSDTSAPAPSVGASVSAASGPEASDADEGGPTGLVIGVLAAVAVLGAGAWWLVKHRASGGSGS